MSEYYNDPVNSPEKYGLELVGQVEWSSGYYEFDTTAVLKNADGRFCYAEDSGCSCPTPFGGQGEGDLTWVTPQELQAHLESRNKENSTEYREVSRDAEIADLMLKVTS